MRKDANFGIVGFGKMGVLHAGILNALAGCAVVSVTEREPMLRRFAAKLLPNLRFYSAAADMMEKEDLDGVFVTTPISSHLSTVEEILSTQERVGLFIEKPLAENYRTAKLIFDISERMGLVTMIGFQKRFSPIFRRAKTMIEEGLLGKLTRFQAYSYASGVFSQGKGWRFKAGEGGALLDLGPHLFDLLLWYFGEPAQIDGKTKSVYSTQVEDFAQGSIRFSSGVTGSFDISWSIEGYRLPEIRIEVEGENGNLHVSDDSLGIELYSGVSEMKSGKHLFQRPEFNTSVEFLLGEPEYCIEDQYFVDCLAKNKLPEPNFRSGLDVSDVIESIRRSAATQRETKN